MTTIQAAPFFQTEQGQATRYTFRNEGGMEVEISSFGGVIVAIRVPDKNGVFADVVLGYDDYAGSRSRKYFLGAAIGRCGNRIGKGQFTLNGTGYQLALNDNGKNHLHGGNEGFDVKLWDCTVIENRHGQALRLSYTSPHGEEQYPGTLQVTMTYSLTADNALELHYEAISDQDTICNLTNHSYFNLAGHNSGEVLNQELKICAEYFTEADNESIPTGKVLPVEGTPMDFREFHKIGERIEADYLPLSYGKGYDHNYVLTTGASGIRPCAELRDPVSGRHMYCLTDCPCVQLYSGNFIDGTQPGKGGVYYQKRGGVCLETQYAPDAIHYPDWDSPILRAGEKYNKTTIYKFGVDK